MPFEILVAEDNPIDVALVREALKEQTLDCNLHVFPDGARTIAFLYELDARPEQPLDLILLDMHLPKYDGEEILRRLRSTENYAQTPVIVMTASDSPYDQDKAERHAALHYFLKPSNLTEFLQLGQIIKDILARRDADGRTRLSRSGSGA